MRPEKETEEILEDRSASGKNLQTQTMTVVMNT